MTSHSFTKKQMPPTPPLSIALHVPHRFPSLSIGSVLLFGLKEKLRPSLPKAHFWFVFYNYLLAHSCSSFLLPSGCAQAFPACCTSTHMHVCVCTFMDVPSSPRGRHSVNSDPVRHFTGGECTVSGFSLLASMLRVKVVCWLAHKLKMATRVFSGQGRVLIDNYEHLWVINHLINDDYFGDKL